jgi:serine/threonine protein kinase
VGQDADSREAWTKLIESQRNINGRYENPTRLNANAGGGAFSLVFTARRLASHDDVCLKFYNPLMQSERYRVACFERESRIMAMLQDEPDILRLVEPAADFACLVNVEGGTLTFPLRYIATELAWSDARHHIYSSKKRSVLGDLQCFRAMCRAVQRIHTRRICHRDVKPENFFLTADRQVRLGDFGTARVVETQTSPLSEDYAMMWRGDRRYTAPELFCGLEEDTGHFFRGDFFALGATLFELLTQSRLTVHIYDSAFVTDLRATFGLMPLTERPTMFADLIPAIAASRPLPNIADFTDRVPGCVLPRIDDLYRSLAALDFRQRLVDWEQVFRRIQICETILRNEEKYRVYWLQKQQWRQKAQEKRARSRAVEPGASNGN